MKKILLIAALACIVASGLFAEGRPSGQWGVGFVASLSSNWNTLDSGYWDVGLSLKAPQSPVFWGINLDLRDNVFGLGLTGDRYIIERVLIKEVNFGWFLGVGGYGNFWSSGSGDFSATYLGLGGRLPVGVYIMPVDFFEGFVNIAPSIGLELGFGKHVDDKFKFPAGRFGVEVGARFWL